MSEGTLRTPACHRGPAEERKGSKLFWARPVREWVTVHCVYPAALAPADRPQESESPWCTGICWALSLIARLSPFRMSVWPRKAQRKRSWGWEEPLLAWVKSRGSLITQRELIKVDLPLVLQPLKVLRRSGACYKWQNYAEGTADLLWLCVKQSVSVSKSERGFMGHRRCRPRERTGQGEDAITAVTTLIGDFDAPCKRAEGKTTSFTWEWFPWQPLSSFSTLNRQSLRRTKAPEEAEMGTWQVLLCRSFRLVEVVIWLCPVGRLK